MIEETLASIAAIPGIESRQVLYRETRGRWRLGLLVEERGGSAIVARPTMRMGVDSAALGPGANAFAAEIAALPRIALVPFEPPAPELSDLVRAAVEAGEVAAPQETVAQRLAEGVAYVERLPTRAHDLTLWLRARGNVHTELPDSFELLGEAQRAVAADRRGVQRTGMVELA